MVGLAYRLALVASRVPGGRADRQIGCRARRIETLLNWCDAFGNVAIRPQRGLLDGRAAPYPLSVGKAAAALVE